MRDRPRDLSIGVLSPEVQPGADTARQAMLRPLNTYPDPLGDPRLRGRVAEEIGAEPDMVAITAGASMALTALFAHLRGVAPVLIPRPGFPGYARILDGLGIGHESYDLPIAGDPVPAIRAAIARAGESVGLDEATGGEDWRAAIVIANPGNPLGTVMGEAEMQGLVACCRRHGVLAIVDQTYHGLIFDPPADPPQLTPIPGAVHLASFSKAPRMAGLRLGYIAASPDILGPVMRRHSAFTLGVSQPSVAFLLANFAGLATAGHGAEQAHLREALAESLAAFDGAPVITSMPRATPLLWVEFPESSTPSAGIAAALRERLHLEVDPGSNFGVHDRGAIRICFGLPLAEIRRVFPAIADLARSGL